MSGSRVVPAGRVQLPRLAGSCGGASVERTRGTSIRRGQATQVFEAQNEGTDPQVCPHAEFQGHAHPDQPDPDGLGQLLQATPWPNTTSTASSTSSGGVS